MGVINGIRVLEASGGWAGQFGGLWLAELGADVVKLEWSRDDDEPAFSTLNRSKSSVAVPQIGAGDLVAGLVERADVVLCDFDDDVRVEHGLTEVDIRRTNPTAVIATVTAYGRSGPYVGLRPDPQIAAALSGHTGSQWSHRDGGNYPVVDYGSHMAGTQIALGTLAALAGRDRDGRARVVTASILGGWMSCRAVHAIRGERVRNISVADPQGGLSPVMRFYRTGDGGWLILACSTPQFFGKLCIALAMPELVADPRFDEAPMGIPAEHKPAIVEILTQRFATAPRDEWIERLRAEDVPCAPVQSPDEVFQDPQLLANSGVVAVDQPGLGRTRQIAPLVRFADDPARVKGPAPVFGSDAPDAVRNRWNTPGRAETTGVADDARLPLAGIRVVEICDWVIGPYAGALLRQFGAEVWKVESISGDNARLMSFVYLPINAGKQVVRVDLSRAEGQSVLHDLIRSADVVIHNHRLKGAVRLGFDSETVARLNPRAVFHEMVAFGRDGPLAGDPAFDQLVPARTGLSWIQGGMSSGHPPVQNNGSSGDLPGGLIAALGVCAGLVGRQAAGRGTQSWSVLFEAGLALNWAENILYDGRPPRLEAGPDFLGLNPARRLYRAASGWVLLSAGNQREWDALAKLVDLDLPAYGDAISEAVDGPTATALQERLTKRQPVDWEKAALAVAVPLVVPRIDRDAVVESYVAENGYHGHGVDEELGEFWFPAGLVQFDGIRLAPDIPTPDAATSGAAILRRIGYDDERISQLAATGVIGTG